MSLLTKLNQWQVAPPPPTQEDNNGGGRNNDKWNDAIFNQLENLQWMIEEKHWQDTIHIGKHLVGRLRNIPETYIRSVVTVLMNDEDAPRVTKYIIRGS